MSNGRSIRLACFLLAFLTGSAWACELGAEQEVLCRVSVDYAKTVLAYERSEYSLKLISDVNGKSIVLVSHHDDETSINPGGGKSVELVIDNASSKVERHFRFQ